jgi:hypothetical protein
LCAESRPRIGKKELVRLMTAPASNPFVERIVMGGFMVAARAIADLDGGSRCRMRIVTARAGAGLAVLGMVGRNVLVTVCASRCRGALHVVWFVAARALPVRSNTCFSQHGLVLVAGFAVDGRALFEVMGAVTADALAVSVLKECCGRDDGLFIGVTGAAGLAGRLCSGVLALVASRARLQGCLAL